MAMLNNQRVSYMIHFWIWGWDPGMVGGHFWSPPCAEKDLPNDSKPKVGQMHIPQAFPNCSPGQKSIAPAQPLHQVTDPSWVSIMLGSNILTASYLPLISITSKNTTSSPRTKVSIVNFEEWLPAIHVNQGGSSWKILFSGGKKKHEQSPWGSGTSFFLTDVEPAEPLGPKSGSNVMSFIILQSISQLRYIKWKSIIWSWYGIRY